MIGIGSSNVSPSQENPFSVDEREELVRKSLDLHFPNSIFDIVQIPNSLQDNEWTEYIMDMIQPSLIISGNMWTKHCFADRGVQIVEPFFDQKISATDIRSARRDGRLDAIEQFIDYHVIEFLKKR